MNRNECANCLVHGWKQPEDKTSLLKCKNCQLIQYCSKECQTEHWMKVHKSHCKYFKDPSKNEPWQHKQQECFICLQVAVVGQSKLTHEDNPNYECIFTEEFTESLVHPHPFRVTGQPGDIVEKGIIVLWQLVRKFQLIHPDVAHICYDEFVKVEGTLEDERIEIWSERKTYPQTRALLHDLSYWGFLSLDFHDIEDKIADIDDKMETLKDPFELWLTIRFIKEIVKEVELCNELTFLKDPLANLPDDIRNIVSEGLDNATEYLTMATKVIESLTTQVISHTDVLKIIGGGSLEKECSFCSKMTDISSEPSSVFLTPLHAVTYSCGSENCKDKEDAAEDDQQRYIAAISFMKKERKANVCDFCFQSTPVKPKGSDTRDIHRCRNCRTTMYCSQDCLYGDDEIHIKVCQEDKEGRKEKPRGSARRKAAREELKMVELVQLEGESDIFCEVFNKFKLKNARKEKN